MKVYGKITDIDYYNRIITIKHRSHLAYYYLTKKMMLEYKNYLYQEPYVLMDVNETKTKISHYRAHEVNHFLKITLPKRYQMKTYFNVQNIQEEIKKLLNKKTYRLFLDLEFSIPGNRGKPASEIVQYGMILEDPEGNIILEESSLLKPYQEKALNARTLLFLSRVYSDFENAPSYIEFYQAIERCIRDYDVKIIAWGVNDIIAMQKSFKFNRLVPLELRHRYLNLMQIMKNYYSYKQEKGLFTTYQELTKQSSLIQNHDALEDARIAREIFHLFRDSINGNI